MQSDPPDFGVVLAVAHATVVDRLTTRMRAASFEAFTTRYGGVLRLLEHGPLSLGALAAHLNMTSQGALKLVAAMAESGYVARVADPADRRLRLVEASPRGREALAAARRVHADLEQELVGDLGVEDVAAARRVLEHLSAGAPEAIPLSVRRAALRG